MLVDHENLGIDTNLNFLSVIFTEIWAKRRFYVMAAINRLRRKFLIPENSILFLCDEDEFVEDHQSKINSVAIFSTSNSNFTGLYWVWYLDFKETTFLFPIRCKYSVLWKHPSCVVLGLRPQELKSWLKPCVCIVQSKWFHISWGGSV